MKERVRALRKQRFGAGFTLLELVVVIIILGVLATLGFTQYGAMVERARGAEARSILGDCRKLAFAYRLANGAITGMTNADVNIGTAADQIPSACRSSHYFYYNVQSITSGTTTSLCATRCSSGGKTPQAGDGSGPWTLVLVVDVNAGTEYWGRCDNGALSSRY